MWYESPLFVAVVTVALTLLTTQLSSHIDRWCDKRNRARSLKLAFKAEVSALREILRDCAKHSKIGDDETLIAFPRVLPTSVYQSNAGNLGELNDPYLVEALVSFYSSIALLHNSKNHTPNDYELERGINTEADLIRTVCKTHLIACMVERFFEKPNDAMIAEINESIQRLKKSGVRFDGRVWREGRKVLLQLDKASEEAAERAA